MKNTLHFTHSSPSPYNYTVYQDNGKKMSSTLSLVTVNKTELLEKIKVNRDGHQKEYDTAHTLYKAALVKELTEKLEAATAGKEVDPYSDLPKPESHVKQYARVIAMLEMSTQDQVQLTDQQFQAFVQDDWEWSNNFKTVSAMYNNR